MIDFTKNKLLTMKKKLIQLLALGLLLLSAQSLLNAQIEFNTQSFVGDNEDELVVVITTRNFREIAGMQFSINWDPEILAFQSLGELNLPDLNTNNFNTDFAINGELAVAWLALSSSHETIEEDGAIFALRFNRLSQAPASIFFDNTPTKIEFVKYPNQILSLVSTVNEIAISGRALEGLVLYDANENCAIDEAEKGLRDWTINIEGPSQQIRRTDDSGSFIAYLPFGTYQVSTIPPPGNLYTVCESVQTISIEEGATEPVQTTFAGQATVKCPSMTVDLGVDLLIRCFPFDLPIPNHYYIAYCNNGTEAAADAYIEFTLDPSLNLLEAEIPFTTIGDNVFRFELGNVDFSYCDFFSIQVEVDCENSSLGQTHCSSAKIFPDNICEPPSENWSKANLKLKADCVEEDSKVRFQIENIGEGNMQLEHNFIVIEDMIMLRNQNQDESSFKLTSGEIKTLEFPANGSTYRLETRQVQHHPVEVPLAVAIEGCGTNEDGTYSRGIINKFEQADESQFEDIECRVNVGEENNNRLLAFPNGIQSSNFIEQNQAITYHINFQNNGLAMEDKVIITDVLSEFLDPSTVIPLVSSHPYELEFEAENRLKFTFENLATAPIGEHFVKFKVEQKQNVPIGSVIENQALVFAGNQNPIITNTYFHTVGEEFIEVRLLTSTNELNPIQLQVSPNPFFQTAIVKVNNTSQQTHTFKLFDLQGREVQQYNFSGNTFELERKNLEQGMYLFEIHTQDAQLLGSGKLVIKNAY